MLPADPALLAPWPSVPDCYGWLRLDRRGGWRLRDEAVRHAGMIAFLNRQYGPAGDGRWVVRNGPQRVFVSLDYTPYVLRLGPDGTVTAHTGEPAPDVQAVLVDDEGNILLLSRLAIGLLDDRDLAAFAGACDGDLLAYADPAAAPASSDSVAWRGLPIARIRRDEVAARFGFVADPHA